MKDRESTDIRRLDAEDIDALWTIHKLYKAAIGEDEPSAGCKERLLEAVRSERIRFYGAWDADKLVGCCSVTEGFSTFDYAPSGVFEDFFILPGYRHMGVARRLVRYAFEESGVGTMTVGCAECDEEMYRALGFTLRLGSLMAFE